MALGIVRFCRRPNSDSISAGQSYGVEGMEDEVHVDDLSQEIAAMMRVGTNIAHKAHGFHSGFPVGCGNGGKRGWVESGCKRDFQLP